jgi:hypothetical protein
MPLSDPELWKLIETWPLPYWDEMDHGVNPPRRSGSFTDSLRNAGDWTELAADEITAAYRRFLYLKALTGETLTPPTWIDEAWHQHLCFPSNYMALQDCLGREILHRQSLTGRERNAAWDRGRDLWKAEFDEAPSPTIWPPRLAWWRPWAAGLVVITGLTIALSWKGLAYLEPGDEFALGLLFIGCLVAVLVLLRGPSPDTVSRCG